MFHNDGGRGGGGELKIKKNLKKELKEDNLEEEMVPGLTAEQRMSERASAQREEKHNWLLLSNTLP